MKRSIVTHTGLLALCLGLSSHVSLAHQLNLTVSAGTTKPLIFEVGCYNDSNGPTNNYYFDIEPRNTPALYADMRVLTKLNNNQWLQKTASPINSIIGGTLSGGGDGTYYMEFTRSAGAPAINLTLLVDYHCMSGGNHTGTQEARLLSDSQIPKDYPYANTPNPEPPKPEPPKPEPPKPEPGTGPQAASSFSASLGKWVNQKQYTVDCQPRLGKSTYRYWFNIRGATKNRPFLVDLSVSKGDATGNVTDPDNSDKLASDWGSLEAGDGRYTMTVKKLPVDGGSTVGNMTFRIQHGCEAEDFKKTKTSTPKIVK